MRRKATKLLLFAFVFIALFCNVSVFAQTIEVAYTVSGTQWSKVLESGETVSFPGASVFSPTLTFNIRNNGASALTITTVNISGANPSHFLYTQPGSFTLASGESTFMEVSYTPPATFPDISTAAITIVSNSSVNPDFVLPLAGPPSSLYGPVFPPFGDLNYEFVNDCPQGNNCIGRAEGTAIIFSNVTQADRTPTYRGTVVNANGDVWIRCSLDDGNFTGAENFTYVPEESDLANGILVHRGMSTIQTVSGNLTVYLKYIETCTGADGITPHPFTDVAELGLSSELGGVTRFNSSADVLRAHAILLASDAYDGVFTPFIDYFESIPDKLCNNCTYYTINKAFYWSDLAPQLTVNAGLTVPKGETITLTTDMLNATDDEELPDNPQNIVFDFNDTAPLPLNSGELKLNNVALTASGSFTVQDLQNGLVTYTHNGSDVLADSFQFRVRDSKGVYASDAGFTVFNFNITIDDDVAVNNLSSAFGALNLLPNPVKEQATLQFAPVQTGHANICLFAPDGRMVATLFTGLVTAGITYQLPITTANLPAGIYHAILQAGNAQQQLKVVVVK
ncbi:hypothetical protein C7N43_25775 [Sphingobacteriales bacterium UPWRP_1]|nr:hypothetical protein B6N25_15950 [Sphingobacteriales bacterium TSM_CSS]PSJ74078.1 hypothetical protein C7N43_25775 [Sphingobacteriales bacterium UPWRP_1]